MGGEDRGGRGVSALALVLQRGDRGHTTQPISGPSRDKILGAEALKWKTDQESRALGSSAPHPPLQSH